MVTVKNNTIAELIHVATRETIPACSFYATQFNPETKILSYPCRVQFYAVGLIQAGWLRITQNVIHYTIRAGQLLLLTPEEIHCLIVDLLPLT